MIVVGASFFAPTVGASGKGVQIKIVLRRKGKTITVGSPAAAQGHTKHGDTMGACTTATP